VSGYIDRLIGPAGKLLQLLDRHPYRPAHIHLIVSSIYHDFTVVNFIIGAMRGIQASHDSDLRQERPVSGERLCVCR